VEVGQSQNLVDLGHGGEGGGGGGGGLLRVQLGLCSTHYHLRFEWLVPWYICMHVCMHVCVCIYT
jgi:hypothetical protein